MLYILHYIGQLISNLLFIIYMLHCITVDHYDYNYIAHNTCTLNVVIELSY